MIAPLQSKPICVEIGQARDHVLDRPCVVRSRRPRRRCLADVARKSAHRHHPARRALGFASRRIFFESDLTSSSRANSDVGLRYVGVGGCAVFGGRARFRRGRSIRALCQTDRLPSRSRACADRSAPRVSCAEATPSLRSIRQSSRRGCSNAIRAPGWKS